MINITPTIHFVVEIKQAQCSPGDIFTLLAKFRKHPAFHNISFQKIGTKQTLIIIDLMVTMKECKQDHRPKHQELKLPADYPALAIFIVFKFQQTDNITTLLLY